MPFRRPSIILLGVAAICAGLLASSCARGIEPATVSAPVTATFDPASNTLRLSGNAVAEVVLDRDVRDIAFYQIDSIDGDRQRDLLRYYSTGYYEELGQSNQDVIIYSRNIKPDGFDTWLRNRFANNFPVWDGLEQRDLWLADLQWRIKASNDFVGRKLCSEDRGDHILAALENGDCYVSCSGESLVAADLIPGVKRVVLLYADPTQVADDIMFLTSEWHTTVEYARDGNWYVADPTFGFAFVQDQSGRRLNVKELIRELDAGRAEDLTFAAMRNGRIHAVPGDKFIERENTLASLYYTADKRIEYMPR